MNYGEWCYNAPHWKKQLYSVIESFFYIIGFIFMFIFNSVGLLFVFNKLAWQWYNIKISIRAYQLLNKCEEKLRKMLYS